MSHTEIREQWVNRPTFIIAAIGSAVGLGNLWRFPYIAARHGGGAFLVPYLIAILTTGIPLMILEYAIGQTHQGSAPKAFRRLGRGFEWIGWFALTVSTIICIYYVAVMAWGCRYFLASFTLEWGKSHADIGNFYKTIVLRGTDPAHLGGIKLLVLAGLAFTWALIYWIICRGVGRVGKVVLLTVPLPVVLLIVLIIRGITLHGCETGLNYYLEPRWSALLDHTTWLAAYGQVFFSLSLGFGILTAYASYLPRNSDVSNSAFMTTFADTLVSYLAGLAVFSVIGYFAVATNQDVIQAAGNGGPGLVFTVYPEAINTLPFGREVFAVAFFVMFFTLGIDSAFSLVEALLAGLQDKWPHIRRARVAAIVCTCSFLLGILFITDPGLVWLDIVDRWCNEYGLVLVGLLECLVVGWMVRTRALMDAVNEYAEIPLGTWWLVSIRFITPIMLATLLAVNLYSDLTRRYEGYPIWALVLGGWMILVGAFVISQLLARSAQEQEAMA